MNACLAVLEDQDITIDGLLEHIQGPDFPTGGIINGRAGIVQAYRTGRGRIYVRGRAEVETDAKGREKIVITEIPFQLNKARLIEKIAELVKKNASKASVNCGMSRTKTACEWSLRCGAGNPVR